MEALLANAIVQWTLFLGGGLGALGFLLWLAHRIGPSPRRQNAVYTVDNTPPFGPSGITSR